MTLRIRTARESDLDAAAALAAAREAVCARGAPGVFAAAQPDPGADPVPAQRRALAANLELGEHAALDAARGRGATQVMVMTDVVDAARRAGLEAVGMTIVDESWQAGLEGRAQPGERRVTGEPTVASEV